MMFGCPYSSIDPLILYILPSTPLHTHHITLNHHKQLPLRCPFSLCIFIHTVCAYYYYDKSREMSGNTQNIPYEIWLIGAISASDKLKMTTISFRFSFSITLHKKSHFLAFLLIMNSQRPKNPQRNDADVRLTDREPT